MSNKDILNTTKLTKISIEAKVTIHKWIGRLFGKKEGNLAGLTWALKRKRKVGRPKTTWRKK